MRRLRASGDNKRVGRLLDMKVLDPREPIDVLIATYNSAEFLDLAIEATKRCVPVARIVAVDHYSTDRTLDILRKHSAEIHFENVSLGYARQLLIQNAKTRVFMMLDSDVVLHDGNWYPRALGMLGSDVGGGKRVGAVSLIPSENPPVPLRKYTEFWWHLIPALERDFFVTHSTLILKEAVEGIKIPQSLGAAEDVYIWLHIRRKGQVTRTIRVRGIHHFAHSESKGSWMGANLRILQGLVGKEVLPFVLRNVCAYPMLSAIAAVLMRNGDVLTYNLKRWYGYLQGYSNPRKFRQIIRTRSAMS